MLTFASDILVIKKLYSPNAVYNRTLLAYSMFGLLFSTLAFIKYELIYMECHAGKCIPLPGLAVLVDHYV